MPGIEINGFEELRHNSEHICKVVLDRVIKPAEDFSRFPSSELASSCRISAERETR